MKTQRCSETEANKSDEVAIINHEHQIDSDVNDSKTADDISSCLNFFRAKEKTLPKSSNKIVRLHCNIRHSKCDATAEQNDNRLQTRLHKNMVPYGTLFATNNHRDSNMRSCDVATMVPSKKTIRKRKMMIELDEYNNF